MTTPTGITAGPRLIAYYGRVSTSLQEDQKTIDNQWMELNELAEKLYGKDGYIVVRKYADEGWSGDILARPYLDQLRQDARAGLWDIVFIYDPDRLARRYSYQELVLDELREAGKEVHFKTRQAPKDPMEKILYGVHGLFSEYERMKIAERFRIGKLRKARSGHIVLSDALYGYTLVRKQGKPADADFIETHYIINEVEARVVRMIFDWVGNHKLSLRKIVRRLQELGIRPRKSKRGVWNTSTLSSMLRNETHIGKGHYGASYATVPKKPFKKERYQKVRKTSRQMKPKEEWIIIPTPALLEGEEGKALFERVQRQLRDNYETSKRNKKNHYLLAERLRCSCGCTRTGEGPQKGKYLYYRCSNRVKNHPLPPTCFEKGISVPIADEKIWGKLTQLMSSKELILQQVERWATQNKNEAKTSLVNTDTLRKEISKLKKQETRYDEAYGKGVFTLAKLQELVKPVKDKVAELESQIVQDRSADKGQGDNSTLLPSEVEMLKPSNPRLLNDLSFEQKREIVLDVIDGIVGVPGKLTVSGFIPVMLVSPYQYDFSFRHEGSSITTYVKLKTSDRYCRTPERRKVHPF